MDKIASNVKATNKKAPAGLTVKPDERTKKKGGQVCELRIFREWP